ncbi:hypothetical protein HK14_03180 [Acetobacter cibinongensis]|uniref:Uncharacterized protein n=1 Tax=Acetobacter cibinongensis TaxID=146475 RepID=A0A1Z5YW57_9PROT|nr:hypothetical protein HK14_03180 [Acetobacter cibinongensis]
MFRVGQHVLSDAEVARQASLNEAVLVQTLPHLIEWGFFARDDAGAVFSTLLYDRILRKEERDAAKLHAQEARAQWVAEAEARGEPTENLTSKQIASRMNGRKGGRPRKNPSTKNKVSRVIADNPTGFVGSVEEERDNTILNNNLSSSPSESREPENPKPDEAEVRLIAQKAREAAGLGNGQRTFSETYVRNFLRDGIDAETILNIAAQKRGEAQKFVYLDIPVRDAFRAKQESTAQALAVENAPDWQKKAKNAYAKANALFAKEMTEKGDFGRVQREWPDTATMCGLPPVERTQAAYEAYFRSAA